MIEQIRKTKLRNYILLIVLTVIFVCLSYMLFENEIESRTMPQVKRAMIQVSKLLPQLEENEQAVREVYDDIEKSRRRVYKKNEDALDDLDQEKDQENVETVIDHTLSWMNLVTMLRVGRRGHVIVTSQEDNTILAHSDEEFVGEKLVPIGKVDTESIPDITEDVDKNMPDKYHAYFPASFFKKKISARRLIEATDAGIYGTAFKYKDTYIICGVTLYEAIIFVIVRTFFTSLFFLVIAWVFICYIGFSLGWLKDEYKMFQSKLAAYSALAVILIFALTWYYQTIMDITADMTTMDDYSKVAVENLNTYQKYRSELSKWLDGQYLEQCRMAAELVKAKGKDDLTRNDLARYAKDLGVKYIYVFDKNGKVVVTNSPYDHFKISNNKEDQSYAFRPLLDGREHVIQKPQKEEGSGEVMQYIGVSLRNDEDLADGFVQITVEPDLRERLLAPINVQTVLDNLVTGIPEHALAIDKDTKKIVATTGMGFENENIEDIGIESGDLKKNYSEILLINSKSYYTCASESEDLYLMLLARKRDNSGAFWIALYLTLFSAAAFFLLLIKGLSAYKKILALKESENEDRVYPDEASEETAAEGDEGNEGNDLNIFSSLWSMIKKQVKYGFENRWKKGADVPLEEQTPEMRTGKIIYYILLIFSILLIMYEVSLASTGATRDGLDGISYVLLGNWPKGFNLFSITYCLFLVCVLYVFQELLNQVLYRIAEFSDMKNETILLLLRNALKYTCAIIFLYLGLAKLGIDTKTLWASVGVLSLLIGFGAKDLISDVIAGLFIIFEGVYKIGDFVTLGDWFGTIEEIGLRYTKIGWFSETRIINNSSIRDIINTDGDVSREILRVRVPYETDLLEIEKMLNRELPKMAKDIPGLVKPPEYQGINSFEDSYIMLRLAIFCIPWQRRRALREFQRQIKLLFDREGIKMPYSKVIVKEFKEEENDYKFNPENELETEAETEVETEEK